MSLITTIKREYSQIKMIYPCLLQLKKPSCRIFKNTFQNVNSELCHIYEFKVKDTGQIVNLHKTKEIKINESLNSDIIQYIEK